MVVTFTISLNIKRYPELWAVLEDAKEFKERSKVARDLMLEGLVKGNADVVSLETLRDLISQSSVPKTKQIKRDEADDKLDAMFG